MAQKPNRVSSPDTLGRTQELDLIATLLVDQARSRSDRSFVLALDAVYGVGKSYFLQLLSDRLSARHPVALVDAWADDTGDEPTVAIMAAIEEALAPFLDKKTSAATLDSLKAARQNIAPIISTTLSGAISKTIGRYIGDLSADRIDQLLEYDIQQDSKEGLAMSDGLQAGVEEANRALTQLADRHAKAQIADYLRRRRSRIAFKSAMTELVSRLSLKTDGTEAPLIILIDELDRCRPDYALKVLEATKHFFDIPGVAFVLALHKQQLIKSVCSVYGSDFNGQDYLQRFFDFTIELPPRDMQKFVGHHMAAMDLSWERMRCPPIDSAFRNTQDEIERYIALIFRSMGTTAREAIASLRSLQIFLQNWDSEIPVELTCLVPKIVHRVRGLGDPQRKDFVKTVRVPKSQWTEIVNGQSISIADLYEFINNMPDCSLMTAVREVRHAPGAQYLVSVLQHELAVLRKRQGQEPWSVPSSAIHSYSSRVSLVERLNVD